MKKAMKPTKAKVCAHGPDKHRIIFPWGSVTPFIECTAPRCECVREIGQDHQAGWKK